MGRTKPTPVQRLDKIVQRVHLASPPSTACDWEGEGWYYKCQWLSGSVRTRPLKAWTKYHRCDSFRELLSRVCEVTCGLVRPAQQPPLPVGPSRVTHWLL